MTEQAIKIRKAIQNHREEILSLAAKHGAKKIRVFGSVARGDAGPESDIDFLVDMDEGRTLLDMGALLTDLWAVFGEGSVDIVTEADLKPRLRDRVMTEAEQI